jgi:hypothetical protein
MELLTPRRTRERRGKRGYDRDREREKMARLERVARRRGQMRGRRGSAALVEILRLLPFGYRRETATRTATFGRKRYWNDCSKERLLGGSYGCSL